MDSFVYKNGKLFAEGVAVETIANEVGTPVYIYSKATFMDHLKKIQTAYVRLFPAGHTTAGAPLRGNG